MRFVGRIFLLDKSHYLSYDSSFSGLSSKSILDLRWQWFLVEFKMQAILSWKADRKKVLVKQHGHKEILCTGEGILSTDYVASRHKFLDEKWIKSTGRDLPKTQHTDFCLHLDIFDHASSKTAKIWFFCCTLWFQIKHSLSKMLHGSQSALKCIQILIF